MPPTQSITIGSYVKETGTGKYLGQVIRFGSNGHLAIIKEPGGAIIHRLVAILLPTEKEFAMAQQITAAPKFAVGDPVKGKYTGEYLGKITRVIAHFYYEIDDDDMGITSEDSIEPAPRFTPEEAWAQLPILILRELLPFINRDRRIMSTPPVYESERRAIRHEAYKFLGGASPRVEITEEVKVRVRGKIREVADILGLLII